MLYFPKSHEEYVLYTGGYQYVHTFLKSLAIIQTFDTHTNEALMELGKDFSTSKQTSEEIVIDHTDTSNKQFDKSRIDLKDIFPIVIIASLSLL